MFTVSSQKEKKIAILQWLSSKLEDGTPSLTISRPTTFTTNEICTSVNSKQPDTGFQPLEVLAKKDMSSTFDRISIQFPSNLQYLFCLRVWTSYLSDFTLVHHQLASKWFTYCHCRSTEVKNKLPNQRKIKKRICIQVCNVVAVY